MATLSKNTLKFNNLREVLNRVHIRKAPVALGVLFNVLGSLVQLSFPLVAQTVVDNFNPEEVPVERYGWYVAIALGMLFLNALGYYILSREGHRLVAELRSKLWDKIVVLPTTFFDNNLSGRIVSAVVNDTDVLHSLVVRHLPSVFSGLVTMVGALMLLMNFNRTMTIILLVALALFSLIFIPIGRVVARIAKELQEAIANLSGTLQQNISENRLMKYSTAEKTARNQGQEEIKSLLDLGKREGLVSAIISPVVYLVMLLILFGLMIYGGIQVSTGQSTIGELVAYLLYVVQIIAPLFSFVGFFTYLNQAEGATSRIVTIMNIEEEDFIGGQELNISNLPIHFDQVSFQYEKADETTLKDITFTAYPGEKLALVGPSGGGKTTIFNLLERFYPLDKGEIRVGDIPIDQIRLTDWRSQIGYVSQDNAMFAGTVRDNLLYGVEEQEMISDDELWRVLSLAQAKDFVEALPDQLDSEIGERGVKLSGGQKQRINIARAFLRDPKILLLDEATASLDSQSEYEVTQALRHLMTDRTTLVITHRLSTIVDADRILFIENGEITGQGSHEELSENHDMYRMFAKQQFTA